jgi:hypothetical protein
MFNRTFESTLTFLQFYIINFKFTAGLLHYPMVSTSFLLNYYGIYDIYDVCGNFQGLLMYHNTCINACQCAIPGLDTYLLRVKVA